MDGSIYYAQFSTAPYTHSPEWFWKVSKRVCLGASEETRTAPGMTASIALTIDMDVSVPASIGNDQYRRSTKDAFQKRWNETFDTLQKARLHGGEYYIDRSDSGRSIYFHAFLREPSRHYIIHLWQDADTAEINITTENSIIKRRELRTIIPKYQRISSSRPLYSPWNSSTMALQFRPIKASCGRFWTSSEATPSLTSRSSSTRITTTSVRVN